MITEGADDAVAEGEREGDRWRGGGADISGEGEGTESLVTLLNMTVEDKDWRDLSVRSAFSIREGGWDHEFI